MKNYENNMQSRENLSLSISLLLKSTPSLNNQLTINRDNSPKISDIIINPLSKTFEFFTIKTPSPKSIIINQFAIIKSISKFSAK